MTTVRNNSVEGAGMTTVATAKREHNESVEAVKAAQAALTEAQGQLDAAHVERDRLDAELDGGASVDAADLSAQIGANNTTVEALTRLRDRRRHALAVAQGEADLARKRVSAAELLALADDLASFDLVAEKRDLLAAVQDKYTDLLARLRDFESRVRRAKHLVNDAAAVGVQASTDGFGSSAGVVVEGRSLRVPAPPAVVRDWFRDLQDVEADRLLAEGREADRARRAEAAREQFDHQQARFGALADAPATGAA